MTTWPGPVAKRPSFNLKGESFPAWRSSPTPKYGPVPTTSPSLPTMRASSVMLPTAFSTPGTARTRSSVSCGMAGRTGLSESTLTTVLAETTAAVPSYAELDSESAAPFIVSVSVYAPLTMATPSTMARAVSTVRRRRVVIPLRPTRVMRSPPHGRRRGG